ncbi:MAG: TVP38/TMEM64 family protein [Candidatus Binatia bacterium]
MRFLVSGVIVALLLALAAAWSWGPLADWVDVAALSDRIDSLRGHPWAPLALLAAYALGSLVLFPVTALIAATAFAFGPVLGFVYSLLGCMSAAIFTYTIGYLLGHETVRRIAGRHVDRVDQAAESHGLLAVVMTHLIPIAPFTIVNVVAGASHIRLHHFVLGTLIGMAPGIVAITLFEQQLENAIRDPGPGSFVLVAALLALTVVAVAYIRRRLKSFTDVGSLSGTKKRG